MKPLGKIHMRSSHPLGELKLGSRKGDRYTPCSKCGNPSKNGTCGKCLSQLPILNLFSVECENPEVKKFIEAQLQDKGSNIYKQAMEALEMGYKDPQAAMFGISYGDLDLKTFEKEHFKEPK